MYIYACIYNTVQDGALYLHVLVRALLLTVLQQQECIRTVQEGEFTKRPPCVVMVDFDLRALVLFNKNVGAALVENVIVVPRLACSKVGSSVSTRCPGRECNRSPPKKTKTPVCGMDMYPNVYACDNASWIRMHTCICMMICTITVFPRLAYMHHRYVSVRIYICMDMYAYVDTSVMQ